ncbi:S9 family peptidase [Hwangdonia lutea]|uniref:Prolyl oligopeptidase family serine peptidase n=1 Tax=Hwangdonia lutea TaxID=3075823 RepID=A0AA97HRC8_9FLAO|nr:prolyl oligopeptidase family serine peptidase [Hwangdonia sp. SCSIO 19198]WOD43708.1 prolyl oligopeptidase family serine peptidase [Hwangdonia sp. SCSIO 19198]
MRTFVLFFGLFLSGLVVQGQELMTPERLWQVQRLSALGLNNEGDVLFYRVSTPNMETNGFDYSYYKIATKGGEAEKITKEDVTVADKNISPDGRYKMFDKPVAIEAIHSKDVYQSLPKSDAYIFTDLDNRHWDTWNDGTYNHVFYKEKSATDEQAIDIMPNEPYYSPQRPFGGDEDYIWAPDSKSIYYVSKKLKGKAYATSTNTDIYKYDLATKTTSNITEKNLGYDTNPSFSSEGALAWLQMKTPGYESDKNDIVVLEKGVEQNLTARWDGTVRSFKWSNDGKNVYFTAPVDGTIQLFVVNYPGKKRIAPTVKQLSEGRFDVTGIVAETKNGLLVTRTDMNHAAEVFSFDLKKKTFRQVTNVNTDFYNKIEMPKIEKRYVTTTDNKQMLVWVILPPNFDASKKYPTLLYAQGGPQSPLSQFYSYRWNFQLMASQGYIIVAPNRRGMPGHGVAWNAAISKDWGGQVMDDYLTAIDEMAKEPYVDNDRLGAIGASFGGYSVFYLAGIHNKRFKTFISHDGVFDNRTMYGTTEELFFVNHDWGGSYWDKDNTVAQKAYNEFNPINMVAKWDTPILIIQGGKDYRVPIEQGLSAFQAARLLDIKSKLLYFPDENHWILQPQNALVWQTEFFKWLKETL